VVAVGQVHFTADLDPEGCPTGSDCDVQGKHVLAGSGRVHRSRILGTPPSSFRDAVFAGATTPRSVSREEVSAHST
jgi:hypothetical protein